MVTACADEVNPISTHLGALSKRALITFFFFGSRGVNKTDFRITSIANVCKHKFPSFFFFFALKDWDVELNYPCTFWVDIIGSFFWSFNLLKYLTEVLPRRLQEILMSYQWTKSTGPWHLMLPFLPRFFCSCIITSTVSKLNPGFMSSSP